MGGEGRIIYCTYISMYLLPTLMLHARIEKNFVCDPEEASWKAFLYQIFGEPSYLHTISRPASMYGTSELTYGTYVETYLGLWLHFLGDGLAGTWRGRNRTSQRIQNPTLNTNTQQPRDFRSRWCVRGRGQPLGSNCNIDHGKEEVGHEKSW